LVNNLGSFARFETKGFMEMLQAGGDVAGGSFTVTSDTSGKQLKRGTKYLFPYGGSVLDKEED
ncbi:hypothetical protein HN51_022641, partial [Arachis hypogaea]